MKEKEINTVTTEDFKPEVVSEMLAFIYMGNISSQDTISEITPELLAVADKYQLDNLRSICEERLCSTLDVANCRHDSKQFFIIIYYYYLLFIIYFICFNFLLFISYYFIQEARPRLCILGRSG